MKEIKEKIKQQLKDMGKVRFKPNRSYIAVWLKKNKVDNLILCIFQGKKKVKACLPWSTIDLLNNDKLPEIINEFLTFKKTNSISKNIKSLEKGLKEKGLI